MYLITTAITGTKIVAAIVILVILIGAISYFVSRRSRESSGTTTTD